jgi:hypothetical protein
MRLPAAGVAIIWYIVLPFATVRRVMPGQISIDGFSRFIFRIFL